MTMLQNGTDQTIDSAHQTAVEVLVQTSQQRMDQLLPATRQWTADIR